jgi:hypothetical protein
LIPGSDNVGVGSIVGVAGLAPPLQAARETMRMLRIIVEKYFIAFRYNELK